MVCAVRLCDFFRFGDIGSYFAIEVWRASKILTPPESSWSISPFSGSMPMQFPVNCLSLKMRVTLLFSSIESFCHCSMTFFGFFSAILSHWSREVSNLLASDIRSQVELVSMSRLVAVCFISSGSESLVWWQLIPIPMMYAVRLLFCFDSRSMPAIFLLLRVMSFGHLIFAFCEIASATATAVVSDRSSPFIFVFVSSTEHSRQSPFPVIHLFAARPRPFVCSSVKTARPLFFLFLAYSAAISFVLEVELKMRISLPISLVFRLFFILSWSRLSKLGIIHYLSRPISTAAAE